MWFGLKMLSSPELFPTEDAASHTDGFPPRGDTHTYGTVLLSHHDNKQITFVLLGHMYQTLGVRECHLVQE